MNLQTVENILAAQKKALVSDISQWLSYLETAAYSYKHPVEYQIMINAYMPEAKACCDSKTWDKLRRDISSPISGIPVIFDGKLEFLYDISQTSKRPDGITPWIWSIEDNALNTSYADIVNSSLSAKYGLRSETFFDNLYELAYNKTSEYFVNDSPELLRLTAESAAYCVMSRCCPDEARPSIKNLRYLSESEFDDVSFRVNRVAGDILSEIEHITKVERNKLIENIRSKNNGEKNLQGRKDNRRGSSRTGFSDRDMDSGDKVRQVRDNMGTGRANGENEVLSDFRQKAEILGDNKGNDGQPARRDGRVEQAGRGAHGEIWNDGSAVRPDTAGGGVPILQNSAGVLEGNSGRGNTGGESAREIHNAAQGLSDESSAGRIHENEEVRKTELSSGSRESESARNSGTDNRADEGRKSGIQTGGGTGRLYENSAADGIVQSSSGRNDTQRDNLQRINQPDIIGNTVYKYIRQKTYRKYDTEIALKIADELDRNGIKFSGKVNGESTTLTISKDDLEKYSEIAERITGEKDKFANGEPEKEVTITQADIDLLRNLEPRKSVLNFTAEEIKLTENWQQRFDSDISKRSPYYRAVNGDWREHDDSRISIIEVEDRNADFKSVRDDIKSQTIKRGNVINHDTNWSIQISRNGLEDSVKYAFTHKDNTVYNMLYHIQDIVESGTLLDSVISEKNNSNKANNTAFMHKFYNVFRFNGEPYLAKTTVEEFADSQSGTLKRVYNIQDIKIEPLRHIEFADNNQLARSVLNGSDISISELFGIVKKCDRDFYLNKRETEKEVTITQADIDLLRSLEPRKSVLNFTAEEIKLTENWQQRFDSDISQKSPYYRAVNGDWREHDDSRVGIIEVEDRNADFTSVSEDIKSQVIKRGNIVNNDTMWSIQISRRGLEDSLTYARRHNDTAVFNMLYNVDDIVKNSSYLDCVVSEKNNGNKANNTAFMHKFYCICKCNNEPYLAKIAVEEFADSKNGTLKRLYNVQDIKIEPLRHAAFTENNQLALSVLNGSDISISELFGIVKNCDGDFYLNKREPEKEVNITQADIDLLRSLEPRKSVLNFTTEEITLTENWQQRFDSDISHKSPYYRAVNGDWREHDDSRVSIIEINDRHATLDSTRDDIKSQVIQRGTVINKDSGWSIQISRKGLEDTVAYASRHKNPVALNALYQLSNLIENSIYLDTNLSEHNNNNKSVNTAFMHKMYSPIVFNDREYIAKLTIEEFFDGRESTSKRLYNLQDIKIEPLRHVSFTDLNQPHLKVLNGSDISISELFELVKNCDKDFYLNKRETEKESEKTLPEEYYSIRRMSDGTYSLYALSCNGTPVIVTPFIETEQNAAALFSETNENMEDVSCTLIPFEQMEQMAQEQLKNEDTSVFYRINPYLDFFRNKNRDENEVTHFIQEYIENENGTAAIGRILYKGDFKNCNAALRRFLTTKQFAKESDIPFSNEFSDGVDDDFDPFAYNGDMSIEDYKNVQSEFLNESEFSNGESEKNEYASSQFDLRCEYVNDEIRVYNTLNDNKAIAFIDSARNTAFLGEDNIPETVKKQVLHMAENYALPYNIPEPEKALPGEPVVIIGQTEHPELREGMKFPLSQADKLFDELDKKQQSDREIYENAGWYHKTDFLIEYEINGQKATYDGRYDIGDGDGTLTEHIKAFAENVLKDDYMKKFWQEKNQLEEKTEQFKYLLSDVIPMFESYSSAERDRHYPVITTENYEISRAVTDIFKNKGKDIRRTDIPIKASDELRRRFELYGVKPSDEQTEITFSTYGNDYDWNRFEIRDRFGNRWVNVYAKDILSEDELETMKSVVSDFYNENLHSEERSGIEEFIDVSDNEYEDSQKTGNNLYVYDAEPKMQQMSLFGDDVADFTSENERKEEIITAVLMRGSGIVDGKFRIADYAKENHSIEDFAKMLKKEYGTGGRSGDDKTHAFEDHDSKGIRITLIRKNELEEGKIIKLSWTDAAKRISELCSNGKYITQNDIDERILHAKYNLKAFAGKTKYEMSEIEWAHKVLDEYRVEYPEKKEISINPYRIYQIKGGEEYHGIRFERIDSLRKSGVELNISDYDLVYEGNLNDIEGDSFDEKLNNLYDLFNFELPEDFKGHSLSVSDVITVEIDKNERAYYVDTLGFVDMPEFLNEKAAPETENRISVGDKFRNKATGEISEVVSLTGALPWYTDQCTINRETGGFSITENISYDKLLNTELYEYIENDDRATDKEQSKKTVLEQAFLDYDVESVMAKSPLAWDEIEDIGYILFEEGYINKHNASEKSIYGNGLHEPDLYDIARRMQDGEDIRKELAVALLGGQKNFTTANDNEFAVEYGENDITAKYGNVEKSVSYEAVGDALLSLVSGEYKSILHDRTVEDLTYSIPDLTNETAEQLISTFDNAIMADWQGDSIKKIRIKKALYDILDDDDKTEKAFNSIANMKYNYKVPQPEPAVDVTAQKLDKAKYLINSFCEAEYDGKADFSDLHNINIAYTTLTDDELPIQVSADLIDFKITYEFDSEIFNVEQYKSIDDMIENALSSLDFNELISVPYSVLDRHIDKEEQTVDLMSAEQTDEKIVAALDSEPEHHVFNKGNNFTITDNLIVSGAKAKFRANIAAIETLKSIEAEKRSATPEEQATMSHYSGWGGLSSAFDESKTEWADEYEQLKELLTDEEYESARASVLDSFYTPTFIIDSVYTALNNMGFEGGNILEPSLGIGNFLGKMPEDMYDKSSIYGTELDSISGRIAKQLYPNADITVTGFEKKDFPDNFFDIAVGNVPFGSSKIPDRRYDKYNFAVHDYFFAKTLDKVRPGGIVAFVTSKGTLDKANPAVRKYISQRAELLGAIRLPNTAFKSYAGTEVTSDIIFLQKRERMIDITPEWVYTGTDSKGFSCNQYFIDNPDMILGETVEGNKLYGKGTMVIPFENSDLKEQLQNAILKINGEYRKEKAVIAGIKNADEKAVSVPEVLPADPDVKNFTYTEIDGKIFYRENSVMTEIKFKGRKLERIKGMAAINKCVRELLDMQIAGYTDETIKEKQSELNSLHDSYIKKYGLLNSQINKSTFKEDVSLPLLLSLEKVKDGKLVKKADIFTKRTIRPPVKITHVDTAVEALAVSISEKACVDLGFMGSLMGGSEKIEQIKSDLKGVIYKNPEKGDDELSGWETADEYLSGNIREKLAAAKKAAENNSVYAENVQALESVMPERIEAGEINVKLGAPWIDEKFVAQFIYEILETPKRMQSSPFNTACIDVQHSVKTASWVITNKSFDSRNVKANVTYGTKRITGYEIIEDSLNQRDSTVNDRVEDEDGKVHYVLNHNETVLARQKQEAINLAFREWIFKDPERREYLVEKYNVLYNSIRPREYDGSHLTFVGMNPEKELRPHQKNAVAHALYGGNTLFAHEVGAGKTYEMIATAMEGKRLGLCSKSLIAVPNHLTEQFANDFMELYPNANLLVAGEKDFKKENRQKLCAKIATGDFDAVIIGHSQLIKIGVSPEREQEFIKQQIEEVTADIAEIKAQNGEHFTIKEMEKTKKDMEARLKKLNDRTVKDDVITFEQLGVDKLFVDEADMFKNLGLSTKMRNISGVSANTKVQKTQDLYMKCQYLDELTGGKGIVFATGTPVSNSVSEIFTMQRYLQADLLRKNRLTHFDAWAASFAEKVTKLEFAPEGTGFRQKTRLAKFYNLPELMTMFKECADIKTAADLDLPTPECEIHNISVKPTETQKGLVKSLGERAERIHNKAVTPDVDNMLKVTTDGRKIGLDQRLINPLLPDEPGTKVNACIENVFRIWNETSENRSTQLIFCDYGVPSVQKKKKDKDGNIITENEEDFSKFNVYDDIRSKLIARGVPETEIAFIHSAKTKEAKEKLFEKVRNGDVRILIGSTSKMGAGTNVQNRLVASHDLDCPWKPRDMEQRRGRMVRQGNENKKVHLYRYVTQDTFDAYLFQTLENKQKFISQIMTSKTPARSCDDIDESTLSYAEVKALCVANPHIKEKMELDIEVSKLQMMKSAFMNTHYRLEDDVLKRIPEKIAQESEKLRCMETDAEAAANYPVRYDEEGNETFSPMTVNGIEYTEKQQAGDALIKAAVQSAVGNSNKAVPIGEYKGFKLEAFADSFDGSIKLFIKGSTGYSITMSESASGNIIRIDNAIGAISKKIEECRERISELNISLENSKAELSKPFPQEKELKEKLARQTELSYLLNLDNAEKQQEQSKQNESNKNRENDIEI